MMKFFSLFLGIMLVSSLLFFTGCKKEQEKETQPTQEETTPEEETKPEEKPEGE